MSPVLEINNLMKTFGGVCAIDNFCVNLESDIVHGLIGPNGAGKTTIFNTVSGIYKPDSGTVKFKGNDITGAEPYKVCLAGVGRTFQNIRLFQQLSVMENVFIASHREGDYSIFDALLRLNRFRKTENKLKESSRDLLNILGLGNLSDERAGSLPYGHQRKLEIARAMATRPKLLLLDEPAAGMNTEEARELVDFIIELKDKFNLSVLIIEHHMDVVMRICNRITVLNFGKTIAEGTPKEIQSNTSVRDAYLGGEMLPC